VWLSLVFSFPVHEAQERLYRVLMFISKQCVFGSSKDSSASCFVLAAYLIVTSIHNKQLIFIIVSLSNGLRHPLQTPSRFGERLHIFVYLDFSS